MRRRLGAAFVGLPLVFVASCSLAIDLDGYAEPAARSDAAAERADARQAGPDPGPGPGADASKEESGAATCDSFRLAVLGCTESPSYFPAGGNGTRQGTPEVIVLAHYAPASGDSVVVTDNRTTPHTLVLASYSSTKWKVVAKVPPAVRVVLAGYDLSSLAGDATVQNDAESPYAYKYPSDAASELLDYAKTKTGAAPVGFAACYATTGFKVDDACP